MNEPSIIVENLSKGYRLGRVRSGNLRETVAGFFKRPEPDSELFWALKDVSFRIEKGETVGIIGRNGAGKSTLLKVLSRITAPTKGKYEINGRISSLLEVGTGFHPELTGRENIFLNGTILGMTRNEVKRKFDEIVAFSGVERFIDTPVKKYSSGMSVRLAFSVAAHLDPEILIVDEVLAVGDAEFQKKCLGKMKDVSSNDGRTILFVSHNLGAVAQLCKKGIYLESGQLKATGDVNEIISRYLQTSRELNTVTDRRSLPEWKDSNHFVSFKMLNVNNEEASEFKHDDPIKLSVSLYLPQYNEALEFALSLYDKLKNRVFTIHENLAQFHRTGNLISFQINLPSNFLTPGDYSWLMCINHRGIATMDIQDDFYAFNIIDNGSDFFSYQPGSYGSVFVKYYIEK